MGKIDQKNCLKKCYGLASFEVVAIALAIALSVMALMVPRGEGATLRVTAEGRMSEKAEKVSMIVSQVNITSGVEKAVEQGETEVEKLVEIAKKLGGGEIKRGYYQVSPQGGDKFIVANAVSVKNAKADSAGALLKEFYAGGAASVGEITFTPADPEETEKKLRNQAIKEAKNKADQLARSMGRSVKKLRAVEEETPVSYTLLSESKKELEGAMVTGVKKITVVYELN